MRKYIYTFAILFLIYNNVFTQETHKNNKFTNINKIWNEAEIGIIINNKSM